MRTSTRIIAAAVAAALAASASQASSHREAPNITRLPAVDATDFYLFNSYEPGRDGLRDRDRQLPAAAGPLRRPQLLRARPGRALRDPHRQQRRRARGPDLPVPVPQSPRQRERGHRARRRRRVGRRAAQERRPGVGRRQFAAQLPRDLHDPHWSAATAAAATRPTSRARTTASASSSSPTTSSAPRPSAASRATSNMRARSSTTSRFPAAHGAGRVFVGQRDEPFAVNLGKVFDLVNIVPVDGSRVPGRHHAGPGERHHRRQEHHDDRARAAEAVPDGPRQRRDRRLDHGVAARRRGRPTRRSAQAGRRPVPATWVQVSRLSNPLVNEVVIGLPDKDGFNASEPRNDGQFATYVTNPTLPALLDVLFRDAVNATLGTNIPNLAPANLPRVDLVTAFLTGFAGVNQQATVTPSEMIRLNTGDRGDARRAAEHVRRRGRRSRGLPERPPAGRRRRRHRAARRHGPPVPPAHDRRQ